MNQRSVSGVWLVTILLLTILAGLSWVDLTLSPASGGQQIDVTGFQVFPVISALLLLQGAALLAALFTPPLVGKFIGAVQVPIVLWHAFVVLTTIQQSLQDAVAAEITKATGVVGVASQAQLVETALDNNVWYIYLAALVLNALALVARAMLGKSKEKIDSGAISQNDADDLWESQR
jgi:hypothetical protein